MQQPTISEILAGSALFSSLPEELMARVVAMSRGVRLEDGRRLFDRGEAAERFFVLESGQMKLFRLSDEGQEKIIEIVRPGQSFAEALMFLDRPVYPVCAQAMGETRVVSVDAAGFAALLRESVDTCFQLLGALSQRIRQLVKEIDDLTLHSAVCRLAEYLLARLEESPGEGEFDLGAPKRMIASRLSMTPETLSRLLRGFSNKGILEVSGGRIRVLDAHGLALEAREDAADFQL